MSGPVLVLVEHAGGEPDRPSLEALALASALGAVEAVLVGPGSADAATRLGGRGATTAHVIEDGRLDAYAPAAYAAALGAVVDARSPSAVLAPGTDRGTEVLAHLGARTGLPMAANVVSVEPGESWRIVRQRWAGSLLEDATLDAAIRLMTGRAGACGGSRKACCCSRSCLSAFWRSCRWDCALANMAGRRSACGA